MKRLMIDCDDTLVLYEHTVPPNPYGLYLGTAWKPNERLIAGIRAFRISHPDALIIIWSGGGKEYARMWADRLLPGMDVVAMIKDRTTLHLCTEYSIVVDDQSLENGNERIRTFLPNGWPEVTE